MGTGIWSMHYIGMLAYRMQVPVLYDWPTVLLSLAAALAASGIAFVLVAGNALSWAKTVLGGTAMGLAIASMHYIGMAAMRMPMRLSYSWPLVAASLAAAVLISIAALRLTFGSKRISYGWSSKKAQSALLMGFAIPSMHYLGMAAAREVNGPGRFAAVDLQHAVSITALSMTGIILVCLSVLGIALVWARIDYHVSSFESALDGSKRSYSLLKKHHELVQGAFRAGGFGIWECDPATGLFYVDDGLRELYGAPHDGQPVAREVWKAAVHPDDVAGLDRRWAECLASAETYENEYRIFGPGREIRRVKSVASLMRSPEGLLTRVLGMTWDVTADRQREEEHRDEATRFRLTLDAIGDAVIATDQQTRIIFINPAASKLTGWETQAAVGRPLEHVFLVQDEFTGRMRPDAVSRCVEHGGTFLAEDGVLVSRAGERYNIREHVALTGKGRTAVITFQDITAARRSERELTHAATHDSLTGLANRASFERKLQELLEESRSSGQEHCLCIIDLDRFKIINDASGHLAGDALLKELAGLMKGQLRPTDLVARMGGDEFMLLLTDTTTEEAEPLLRALLSCVSELRFSWQGKIYDVTASIGLVFFDCFSPEAEVLVSQADAAVFTAKRNGRNQVVVYGDKGSAADHLLEIQVASDLRRYIEENRFELFAQPIVPSESPAEVSYFEVLLRLRGDEGELISPAHFIPAAERFGMMGLLDRWVIRNTLRLYGESAAAEAGFRLSINLSGESLSDESLWPFILKQFVLLGVAPSSITFEVTETGIIRNLDVAREFMRKCRQAGCGIALDDFGTGLSSLSYLKQFPLDTIKIDGEFIRTLLNQPVDQAIIRAIGDIARSIDATTVSECVEDSETLEMLRELKVDWIQGWVTGRPIPLQHALATATARKSLPMAEANVMMPLLVLRDESTQISA